MKIDTYERLSLVITEFDAEDVIVTSGEQPEPQRPDFMPGLYEGSSTGAGMGTPYGF